MINEDIDIKRILNIILSKKIFIILIMIVSLAVGYVYSYYYKVPEYKSSVTVLLGKNVDKQDSQKVTQYDLSLNTSLITTYISIAKSDDVISKVIENLNLNYSTKELQNKVNVTQIDDSQIIEISVSNTNGETAMKVANEIADVFISKVKDIYNLQNINVIDKAEVQNVPYNVNHIKDLLMFGMFGIILSGILVFIFYIFDDSIKDEKDISDYLKLEPIGIMQIPTRNEDKLITDKNPKSYVVECIKTIRTNMIYMTNNLGKKSFLFTSTNNEKESTFIVTNIAKAFAEAEKRVLLVDANLRRENNLNSLFNIENSLGLSDYIKNMTGDKIQDLELAKKYIKESSIPNLHILGNGTIPSNPAELISSDKVSNLLDLFKIMYDVVLIDGASIANISDSIALSAMVDKTILIAKNKKTKISEMKKAKKAIEDVGGSILGVILAKDRIHKKGYYGKGYGYYYKSNEQDLELEAQEKVIISVEKIINEAKEKIDNYNKIDNVKISKENLSKEIDKEINETANNLEQINNNDLKLDNKPAENNENQKIEKSKDEQEILEKMDTFTNEINNKLIEHKESFQKEINEMNKNNNNEQVKEYILALDDKINSFIQKIDNKFEETENSLNSKINEVKEENGYVGNINYLNQKINFISNELNEKLDEHRENFAEEIDEIHNSDDKKQLQENIIALDNKLDAIMGKIDSKFVEIESNFDSRLQTIKNEMESEKLNNDNKQINEEKEEEDNFEDDEQSNVISFEKIREKRIKRTFSIDEPISFEELEKTAIEVIEFNKPNNKNIALYN